MKIHKQQKNGYQIVALEGTIDSSTASRAHEELDGAIGDGSGNIILDLSSLVFISSAGLRVLLLLAKKVKQAHGTMSLCAMPQHVRDVFEIAGFSLIFDIRPSVESVVAKSPTPATPASSADSPPPR